MINMLPLFLYLTGSLFVRGTDESVLRRPKPSGRPRRNSSASSFRESTSRRDSGTLAFNDSTEPILAIVHCRHGTRAPNHQPYEQDKYTLENQWHEGWGELIKEGMLQCYELGKVLRKRYSKFVHEKFDRYQVHARSTELDRTIQSALALLSGFYRPEKEAHRFHNSINWVPVPVHSGGVDQPDPLLKPSEYECAKYKNLSQQVQAELERMMNIQFANVFPYLREKIGPNAGTLKQLRKLNDVSREVELNLRVDEWLLKKIWHERNGIQVRDLAGEGVVLRSTLDLAREVHYRWRNEILKGEMALLQGGYLLGDYLKRAQNLIQKYNDRRQSVQKEKSKKTAREPKMVIYMSHDVTIMALLNLLGLRTEKPVPQASCFIMEVYIRNGKAYVQFVFYENKKFTRLEMPFCDQRKECYFKTFVDSNARNAFWTREELDLIASVTNNTSNIQIYVHKYGKLFPALQRNVNSIFVT